MIIHLETHFFLHTLAIFIELVSSILLTFNDYLISRLFFHKFLQSSGPEWVTKLTSEMLSLYPKKLFLFYIYKLSFLPLLRLSDTFKMVIINKEPDLLVHVTEVLSNEELLSGDDRSHYKTKSWTTAFWVNRGVLVNLPHSSVHYATGQISRSPRNISRPCMVTRQ